MLKGTEKAVLFIVASFAFGFFVSAGAVFGSSVGYIILRELLK